MPDRNESAMDRARRQSRDRDGRSKPFPDQITKPMGHNVSPTKGFRPCPECNTSLAMMQWDQRGYWICRRCLAIRLPEEIDAEVETHSNDA